MRWPAGRIGMVTPTLAASTPWITPPMRNIPGLGESPSMLLTAALHRACYEPHSSLNALRPSLRRGRQFRDSRHEARGAELLGRAREGLRRSAPAHCLQVGEERRIGTQGCQFLEEQRELSAFAEDWRGKLFDRAVARD